jgi:hypothetical protein
MKTLILTLSILFLSFPLMAQDQVAFNDGKKSPYQMKTTVGAAENLESKDTKRVAAASARVEALRAKVAGYDLKSEKIYSRHASSDYKVVFTDGTNTIEAIYDSRGDLLNSLETYENVRLPNDIIKQVMTENQGWTIEKVLYLVTYKANQQIEAQYNIEMTKDGKKRTVKVSE